MRFVVAILLLVTVAFAGQGEKPHAKKKNVAGVDTKAPVTRSEAAAVFARARKAINLSRIANVPEKPTIAAGNQTVTREEIILEMAKIFEGSKKAVKFMPALTKYEPKHLKAGSVGSKAALQKLVSWGFIAPVGALATGPKPGLSVQQFGDAVGFFMARLADVTHMPSPRWSPYMMPNEDGE
jgi:hypothetical protein